METKEPSLTELLNNVMGIANYKGKLVTKIIGGYSWNNQKFKTQSELDESITKSEQVIQNSIK